MISHPHANTSLESHAQHNPSSKVGKVRAPACTKTALGDFQGSREHQRKALTRIFLLPDPAWEVAAFRSCSSRCLHHGASGQCSPRLCMFAVWRLHHQWADEKPHPEPKYKHQPRFMVTEKKRRGAACRTGQQSQKLCNGGQASNILKSSSSQQISCFTPRYHLNYPSIPSYRNNSSQD